MAGEDQARTKALYDDWRNAWLQGGKERYWQVRLDKALKASPQGSYATAFFLAHLGRVSEAYDCLFKIDRRELQEYLWSNICFDRSDPRFLALARKAGKVQSTGSNRP